MGDVNFSSLEDSGGGYYPVLQIHRGSGTAQQKLLQPFLSSFGEGRQCVILMHQPSLSLEGSGDVSVGLKIFQGGDCTISFQGNY